MKDSQEAHQPLSDATLPSHKDTGTFDRVSPARCAWHLILYVEVLQDL